MPVSALGELHDQGRMTWAVRARGWMALPDEVVDAFARCGFEECKRATTTSRRDLQPAGGVWQGVNHATGSVASAIWVARGTPPQALMFLAIDGERVEVAHVASGDASYHDQGGES